MPTPEDYAVNEAWIVFQVTQAPVRTEADGDFHLLCLMDAASLLIMANEMVPAGAAGVPGDAAERLLEAGAASGAEWPRELLLQAELRAEAFEPLADGRGIAVRHVADSELLPFVSEAREAFREYFRRGGGGR